MEDEYLDVRVFLTEGKGTKEIDGVSVGRYSKIGNIKKYFLERYPEFDVRFFPNKRSELRNMFSRSSTTYNDYDLSSVFDKMKNPMIVLVRNYDVLPDLSTLKIK